MRAGAIVGLLVSWIVGWSVVSAQEPTLTRGPYLQSTTRESVIVVWQTSSAGDSVVDYGESGYTQTIGDPALVMTHVITVTGLTAGTTYPYRISTGGAVLHEATFSTAPDPGGAFSFVVIGDSGTGYQAQYDVAARMLALDPDVMLHTGDVIYPAGEAQNYNAKFFTPYRDLVDHIPVFPSLGNHDYIAPDGQPYLEAFYLPGGERYYSFDWGDAHFVVLDSTPPRYKDGPMLQWLQSDLAASTARWTFVFFHHAMFTVGPHVNDPTLPDMRATLAPIFSQHGVDIVFNGHDHDYERSHPQNGVIYIVSGGGGASLYDPVTADDAIAYFAKAYHTVEVQITGCILSLRAIDTNGAVLDQIALAKDCPHHVYLPIILKQ